MAETNFAVADASVVDVGPQNWDVSRASCGQNLPASDAKVEKIRDAFLPNFVVHFVDGVLAVVAFQQLWVAQTANFYLDVVLSPCPLLRTNSDVLLLCLGRTLFCW